MESYTDSMLYRTPPWLNTRGDIAARVPLFTICNNAYLWKKAARFFTTSGRYVDFSAAAGG